MLLYKNKRRNKIFLKIDLFQEKLFYLPIKQLLFNKSLMNRTRKLLFLLLNLKNHRSLSKKFAFLIRKYKNNDTRIRYLQITILDINNVIMCYANKLTISEKFLLYQIITMKHVFKTVLFILQSWIICTMWR